VSRLSGFRIAALATKTVTPQLTERVRRRDNNYKFGIAQMSES